MQLDRRHAGAKAGQHDGGRRVLIHAEGGRLVPAAERPQHAAHPRATQPFGDPVRLTPPPALQLPEVGRGSVASSGCGLDRLECHVLVAQVGEVVAGATEVAVAQAPRQDQHRAEEGEHGPQSPERHPEVVERLGVLPVEEALAGSAELASGIGDRRRGLRSRSGRCGGAVVGGWD